MLGLLALAVGDASACSPCGGNDVRGSCPDRVSAVETKRRTPAHLFFLTEGMIPPIKLHLPKKGCADTNGYEPEVYPLFSLMAKRVNALAGHARVTGNPSIIR